jgi:hypothetical protein
MTILYLRTIIGENASNDPKEILGKNMFDSAAFQTFKSVWLFYTIYYLLRSVVLYLCLDSLSQEVVREIYSRRVLRNYLKEKNAPKAKGEITVTKSSGIKKFLNLVNCAI